MTTYKDSGVDIEKADKFVEYIKKKLKGKETITPFGGFAGGLALEGFKNPVVFSSADGVGTKLKVAQAVGKHDTVGIDLVAMNANDLITTGAKPWFFLDYIATGKLELKVLQSVIDGIVKGCEEAEAILLGGETAEMPDFYPEGVYDLAGFCVGVCEREEVRTGEDITEGDTLLGLPSSGFHSNGFSLIRKVLRDNKIGFSDYIEELKTTVAELLLTPTRIYVKELKRIKSEIKVKAVAHITGGGIPGNLIRILPEGFKAVIEKSHIPKSPAFEWIQGLGKVPEEEMFRTFNMGVGMIIITDSTQPVKGAFKLGFIEKGDKSVEIV